jgi:ElaB/YqjD/DUF883 family membrane-anchored ribosome-binding protein
MAPDPDPHPLPTPDNVPGSAAQPGNVDRGAPGNSSHGGIPSGSPDAGNDVLNRVVQGAHETIDRLAESAAPHVHRLQDSVTGAADALQSRAGEAREIGSEWTDSLRSTVRENPLASVATALAIGLLLARLTS